MPDGRARRGRRRGCTRRAQAGLDESLALHRRWHGAADGRLRAALAPRFAISCTRELLEATAAAARCRAACSFTPMRRSSATKSPSCAPQTGLDNIAYLAAVGLATDRLCAAHCVWVTDAEQRLLAERGVKVPALSRVQSQTGIGHRAGRRNAGARHFGFAWRRRRGVQQRARHVPGDAARRDAAGHAGAGPAPCRRGTWCGWRRARARARSAWVDDIGSIEVGKKGRRDRRRHRGRAPDARAAIPYAQLVYATRPSDVRATLVDGRDRGQMAARSCGKTLDVDPARPRQAPRAC